MTKIGNLNIVETHGGASSTDAQKKNRKGFAEVCSFVKTIEGEKNPDH